MMTAATVCLAAAIFFEARSEPTFAQHMVAEVILNRVEHSSFPDDVCSVVYEDKQFSFTHDGKSDNPRVHTSEIDRRAYKKAVEIASMFLDGYEVGSSSTHYHTTYVRPSWSKVYKVDGKAGDHIFYTCSKEKRNC
jgi:spore germination cell wall hydrolase CwlJ-like protein